MIDSNAPVGLGDPTVRMPNSLRLVLLLLPSLLLAGLEALHPQPEPTVQAMLDVATWFATFHVIQLVLIGFVALSVLLLADTFGRANAWATRLGLGLFLVFFSAYDTLAGIGTGLAMREARDLSPTQQDGVLAVVQDWPGLGPPFALSILGTAGWVIVVGALAVAAYRPGEPAPSLDRPWTGRALPAGRTPVPGRNVGLRILLSRRPIGGMGLAPAQVARPNFGAVTVEQTGVCSLTNRTLVPLSAVWLFDIPAQ